MFPRAFHCYSSRICIGSSAGDDCNFVRFQIGLPREHASALCKVYSDNLSQITKVLKNESLQIGRLSDVDVSKTSDNEYLMKLNYAHAPENSQDHQFTVTREQIQLLISGIHYMSQHTFYDDSHRELSTCSYAGGTWL